MFGWLRVLVALSAQPCLCIPVASNRHTVHAVVEHVIMCACLQERNAAIIRAEGESEAAKLISDATKTAGVGLVELRRIEAAKDIAETMSKSQNVVYLPSGGNMLLGLNPR